jgi:hypothetical protein
MLSLGSDLGMGQPMEHAMRQCLIAMPLGDRFGVEQDDRVLAAADAYQAGDTSCSNK